MANNNTKAKRRLDRKAKNYFHGSACDTGHGAPANKRKSKHDYSSVVRGAK
jgi:hypothetical protein